MCRTGTFNYGYCLLIAFRCQVHVISQWSGVASIVIIPLHMFSFKVGNIIWWPLWVSTGEGNVTPLQYSCLENPMDGGAWWAAVYGVAQSRTRLSDFTFTFHFHALEKAMATHSSVLAWRIPGMGKPGGLLSMGSHRVRHDWSDLAAAAAVGEHWPGLGKLEAQEAVVPACGRVGIHTAKQETNSEYVIQIPS